MCDSTNGLHVGKYVTVVLRTDSGVSEWQHGRTLHLAEVEVFAGGSLDPELGYKVPLH